MAWWTDWMNTVMVCPNGCEVTKDYLAPEFPLRGSCGTCGEVMEGVRVIKKENA